MMLGITVTVVAFFAMQINSQQAAAEPEVAMDVRVLAREGDTQLIMTHLGGPTFDPAQLRIVTSINGVIIYDGPPTVSGTLWRAGEHADVGPFATPLPVDAPLEIAVVSLSHGQTVVNANVRTLPAAGAAAPNSPIITVTFEGGTTSHSVLPPAGFIVNAKVVHADGRKAIRQVVLDMGTTGGGTAIVMRDDGTAGDATAGDGVYTASPAIPSDAPLGFQTIAVRAFAFDGGEGLGTALVNVLEPIRQKYNATQIQATGHRMLKYEGGNNDKVTVHYKIRLAGETTTTPDGKTWQLNGVSFDYERTKPGSYEGEALSLVCQDTANHVRLYKAENVTMGQWNKDMHTLKYYFTLSWQRVGPSESFSNTVETTATDESFTLRRSDDPKIVRDGTWPLRFDDCSDV